MAKAAKRATRADPWENRKLGQDEKYAQRASAESDSKVDDALGLQMISIRLPRQLIERLKLIATHSGVGYQPLMRDVLSRYAHGELIQVLRQQAEIAQLEDRSKAAYEVRAAYAVKVGRKKNEVSRAALSRLCRKYGIRKLGLFGSAARRELRSTSDVDLLVEFGPESHASLFDFPEMQRDLSAVFGNRSVDLVPPQVMRNPHRRKAMMADLRVLYQAR
jgi:predicted nucleotidyltransferase/predicted DNA binding CopG/RHH family protein